MSAVHHRGSCPRLLDPMSTGDGLLVRLVPIGSTVSPDAMSGLCAAARVHGNGVIEITARGSIQVRGLTVASAPRFAQTIKSLGIEVQNGIAVITDPLAGLSSDAQVDARSLAEEVRRELHGFQIGNEVSPKLSVAIDSGGALHLDGLTADVRLDAVRAAAGAHLHIALGGDATAAISLGSILPQHAARAVALLISAIASRGPGARARDVIGCEGIKAIRGPMLDLFIEAPVPTRRPPAEPVGVHRMRERHVAFGIALAFGHSDAYSFENLCFEARRAGANGFRTAPGRALLITGVVPDRIESLAANAERLGFIVRGDDPRRSIVACAGSPICASGQLPARTLAPRLAACAASLLDGSLTVHLSGCAKGCAHAGPVALTIVGSGAGAGIVVDGSTRDAPRTTIAADRLPAGLERLTSEAARTGRPGEPAADVLARLGSDIIVKTIAGEVHHA
jgi:precorrin-3B synthase